MEDIILKMPKTESDGLNGINDSGIETYKNIPMLSLTKEELQNSCDAALKNGKPVVVEFSDFHLKIDDIPSGKLLLDVYKRQRDFWDDYLKNDKKAVEFFDNGIRILEKGDIRVLRISDFNTTGLKDIDGKSSSWNNLVKNRFVSDKPGYAGGSFGIGKDAAFACSELRTVFYNTLNEDNDKAFQGTVRLPSYSYNNENYTGDGFFSKNDGTKANDAVRKNISLEPGYKRSEPGMDKYIFGFGESFSEEQLKEELIVSSIDNYLYAFYTEKLVVKCGNTTVDKAHLDDLFSQYHDKFNTLTIEYYETLKNPDRTDTVEVFDKNDVKIFVKLDNNYSRRAAVLRQTGMKVFDKGNISGRIGFSAVVILDGDRINEYFKKLENAEHTQWSDFRSSDKSEAEKYQKKFFGRLKDIVNELHNEDYESKLDSEGTSEYLPYAYVTGKSGNKTEGLSNNVVEKKKKPKKKKKKPETAFTQEEFHYEVDEAGNIIEETVEVRRGKDPEPGPPHPNPIPGPEPNPDPNGQETRVKESDKFTAKKEVPNSNFTFALNKKGEEFSFVLIPKENIKECFMEIMLSGEQNAYSTSVTKAEFDDAPAQIRNNKIYFGPLKKDERHRATFSLSDKGEYSLEVKVYESKS